MSRRPITLAILSALTILTGSPAEAACQKEDFAAVVDQSGTVLRTLNDENKRPFQDKLRLLKTKFAWTDQQFLTEAKPYVIDDKIKAFDTEVAGLLEQINTLGDTSGATLPDCAVLDSLKGNLSRLVDVVKAKWLYMTGKIDAALK